MSQGYEDPLPLSKTRRGWEPSGGGALRWGLLGPVEVRQIAGLSGAHLDRPSSGLYSRPIANSDSDIGGVFEREGFNRTDSGRYDDIALLQP
jgi:hypothetical protein